jgi:hypothetical protein
MLVNSNCTLVMKNALSLVSTMRSREDCCEGGEHLADQLTLAATGLLGLCDSGRAGALGQKACEKAPRIGRRRSRPDPRAPPFEI